jgi:hypothetical protein
MILTAFSNTINYGYIRVAKDFIDRLKEIAEG